MVFGLIGLMVVGAAVYLYMQIAEAGDMWPKLNAAGTLSRQIQTLNADIKKLNEEQKKIPILREQLEKLSVDYDYAATVLPRVNSPDQLLAAIRTKAQQSGVFPSSLNPTSAKGGGRNANASLETLRFTIVLEGNYDEVATFVNRMEEFDSPDAAKTGTERRFFELKNIKIAAVDNGQANLGLGAGNNPIKHKCDLVMQTYSYAAGDK